MLHAVATFMARIDAAPDGLDMLLAAVLIAVVIYVYGRDDSPCGHCWRDPDDCRDCGCQPHLHDYDEARRQEEE